MPSKFNLYSFTYFCGRATKGDILCEMRFHVPNNELEKYHEEKEKAAEESKEPVDEDMEEE
jgi:hypothetical protein